MACNCIRIPASNFQLHFAQLCLSERLSRYLMHQSSHSVTKVAHTTVELSADADCTPSCSNTYHPASLLTDCMACNCFRIPASNFQLPNSLRTCLLVGPSAFPATQFTSPATRLPRSNSPRWNSLLTLIVLHRLQPCSNTYHTTSLLADCMACNCRGYRFQLPISNFTSHNFVAFQLLDSPVQSLGYQRRTHHGLNLCCR